MWSKGSESVKYCVQDRCQGYEPRVLSVSAELSVESDLEIIASVLFSLITILIILSVMSINALVKPRLICYNIANYLLTTITVILLYQQCLN